MADIDKEIDTSKEYISSNKVVTLTDTILKKEKMELILSAWQKKVYSDVRLKIFVNLSIEANRFSEELLTSYLHFNLLKEMKKIEARPNQIRCFDLWIIEHGIHLKFICYVAGRTKENQIIYHSTNILLSRAKC
jgi:hypothetical protein